MLPMLLCTITRCIIHVSFLTLRVCLSYLSVQRTASAGILDHKNNFQRMLKKCWSLKRSSNRTVRLREHVSEQSCPLDVLYA